MRVNNREKILETARKQFLKYGFNGISIRSIASRARLTTGAIYFHFKNKKDIYKTICIEAIDILIKSFRNEINRRKTPPQKLISTYDAYINFFYEHREYYNILMEFKATYFSEDDTDRKDIAERMSGLIDINSETIKQGIEAGFYRDIDSIMLSTFLAAVAEGMLQFKKLGMLDSIGISDNDFRNFMTDIIGRGIQKK